MNNLEFESIYTRKMIRRNPNGYIRLTDLTHKSGARIPAWFKRDETQKFIKALARKTLMPSNELIYSVYNGDPTEKGVWCHPAIAIQFCFYRHPRIAVQLACLITEQVLAAADDIHSSPPERKKPQLKRTHTLRELVEVALQKAG